MRVSVLPKLPRRSGDSHLSVYSKEDGRDAYSRERSVSQREYRRKQMDQLALELGIRKQEDWYHTHHTELVIQRGATFIKTHYNGSIHNALQTIYPEFTWEMWKFHYYDKSYWSVLEHQRKFFDSIADDIGIETQEDWYKVNFKHSVHPKATKLFHSNYGGNAPEAVMKVYSEFEWYPWKFAVTPSGYWNNEAHCTKFLNYMADELGVEVQHDWYEVNLEDLKEEASGLVALYANKGLMALLATCYPQYVWYPWLFSQCPRSFDWNDKMNQRQYLLWLEEELMIRDQDEWYDVTYKQILPYAGSHLNKLYPQSLTRALSAVFPEKTWYPWITRVPSDYWKESDNASKFMDWLLNKLGITSHDEWHYVPVDTISKFGGRGLLKQYGGVYGILRAVYPGYKWNQRLFTLWDRKVESLMYMYANKLFGHLGSVYLKYQHPQLQYPDTNSAMEFDVFIPFLSVALEYQGAPHFDSLTENPPFVNYSAKDKVKRAVCSSAGVSLIEIPYWWDRTLDSLLTSILKVRPDVQLYINSSAFNVQSKDNKPIRYIS